jgi:hypothetical protein
MAGKLSMARMTRPRAPDRTRVACRLKDAPRLRITVTARSCREACGSSKQPKADGQQEEGGGAEERLSLLRLNLVRTRAGRRCTKDQGWTETVNAVCEWKVTVSCACPRSDWRAQRPQRSRQSPPTPPHQGGLGVHGSEH